MKGVTLSYPVLLLSLLLLLSGCGGGGSSGEDPKVGIDDQVLDEYSGSTIQAKVDDASVESLSMAVISGANQSILTVVPLPSARAPAADSQNDLVNAIREWLVKSQSVQVSAKSDARQADNSADLCPLGGTAFVEYNDPGTVNDFTFTDCTYTDGLHTFVVTGLIHVERDENGILTSMQGVNLVIAIDGTERILNFTLACTSITACSYYSDFRGYDDRLYRLNDIGVRGDASSGYMIDARIYDPDIGYVDFSTSAALVFDCPGGYPSTGTIDMQGADGSTASVTYNCAGFIATVLGGVYTFYW